MAQTGVKRAPEAPALNVTKEHGSYYAWVARNKEHLTNQLGWTDWKTHEATCQICKEGNEIMRQLLKIKMGGSIDESGSLL